jgi:hypothetical protein
MLMMNSCPAGAIIASPYTQFDTQVKPTHHPPWDIAWISV